MIIVNKVLITQKEPHTGTVEDCVEVWRNGLWNDEFRVKIR